MGSQCGRKTTSSHATALSQISSDSCSGGGDSLILILSPASYTASRLALLSWKSYSSGSGGSCRGMAGDDDDDELVSFKGRAQARVSLDREPQRRSHPN